MIQRSLRFEHWQERGAVFCFYCN